MILKYEKKEGKYMTPCHYGEEGKSDVIMVGSPMYRSCMSHGSLYETQNEVDCLAGNGLKQPKKAP